MVKRKTKASFQITKSHKKWQLYSSIKYVLLRKDTHFCSCSFCFDLSQLYLLRSMSTSIAITRQQTLPVHEPRGPFAGTIQPWRTDAERFEVQSPEWWVLLLGCVTFTCPREPLVQRMDFDWWISTGCHKTVQLRIVDTTPYSSTTARKGFS